MTREYDRFWYKGKQYIHVFNVLFRSIHEVSVSV